MIGSLEQPIADDTGWCARSGAEFVNRHRRGTQRCGNLVRNRQHGVGVAEAGQQAQPVRGCADASWKVGTEPWQVGRRRPPPSVDALARVAYGGDGVSPAT